jgi:sulfite reductase (NADPH) hemoprotein beta-component
MHAIQTSGNCIRNTTADHFAGVAPDEIEDPRVWAEIIRQWSTLHPEFAFLPRKFKIAVTGASHDRAAVKFHDIGLKMVKNDAGEVGFEVIVGGGMGRTPAIGPTIRSFLPKQHLLSYLEAILRVYNLLGRRDNLYKARIKILVTATGTQEFARLVEEEWARIRDGVLTLPREEVARIEKYFTPHDYEKLPVISPELEAAKVSDPAFARWFRANTHPHKVDGYRIVTISLKPEGGAPGDASADQMDLIADLADEYSFKEIRVSHHQNLVLPNVRQQDLYALWQRLAAVRLANPNVGFLTDIISCPGLDYCNLANARSIPIAQRLSRRFNDFQRLEEIGELRLNISGCINACGHHHAGNIGILGVDKQGEEFYQITLGGSSKDDSSIGKIMGPAFSIDQVADAVENIVNVYLEKRSSKDERFLETFRRVGLDPFKEKVYGNSQARRPAAE